ncbi:hypothetical protein FQN57_002122 [Myotisia sp. PD_48]|nr:hypothetical protein FQN57_002122 [Myotisia sp. PD_48]
MSNAPRPRDEREEKRIAKYKAMKNAHRVLVERLPDLQYSDITTKSSALHNSFYAQDLVKWDNFEDEVAKLITGHSVLDTMLGFCYKQLNDKPYPLHRELVACGDEHSVYGSFGDFEACQEQKGFTDKYPKTTIPNFVAMDDSNPKRTFYNYTPGNPHLRFVGEAKTPWVTAHELDRLVDNFERDQLENTALRHALVYQTSGGFDSYISGNVYKPEDWVVGRATHLGERKKGVLMPVTPLQFKWRQEQKQKQQQTDGQPYEHQTPTPFLGQPGFPDPSTPFAGQSTSPYHSDYNAPILQSNFNVTQFQPLYSTPVQQNQPAYSNPFQQNQSAFNTPSPHHPYYQQQQPSNEHSGQDFYDQQPYTEHSGQGFYEQPTPSRQPRPTNPSDPWQKREREGRGERRY